MGKVSRYVAILCIVGAAIVGFWVYQKYFRESGTAELRVPVSRGDMQQVVRARGEAVPDAEYDLEFSAAGTVSAIYVKEGQTVAANARLASLDTQELQLEETRLEALLAERTSDRDKLLAGGSASALAVAQAKVTSAQSALAEAEKVESAAVRTIATSMDDAVHNTTDDFYSNPRGAQPQLLFSVSDSQMRISLQNERTQLEGVLAQAAAAAATSSGISTALPLEQSAATRVGTFLDGNADALNQAVTNSGNASDIARWLTAVKAARAQLDAANAALTTAEQSRMSLSSSLAVAQQEFAALRAPARPEDVAAANAAVADVESQIAIAKERIRKATIYAPEKAEVMKLGYRIGETARPGTPAIILHTLSPKIESDISELDIPLLSTGLPATIAFDAVPGEPYPAILAAIDPQKIDKDGDTYYRVDFSLSSSTPFLRAGMSADVRVSVSHKQGVLKIPEYAAYEREGKTYVRVVRDGAISEVPVVLGISDGESREVVSGLSEGDTVVVSTQ